MDYIFATIGYDVRKDDNTIYIRINNLNQKKSDIRNCENKEEIDIESWIGEVEREVESDIYVTNIQKNQNNIREYLIKIDKVQEPISLFQERDKLVNLGMGL